MRPTLPFSILFGLSLAACIGSGDNGADGPNISGSMDVLSIDRQAHTITTSSTANECQSDGSSISQTDTSVDHYAIKDGHLILWNEEECKATTLAGTSTDIVGSWTGLGVELESAIPAEYRPATCPATVTVDSSGMGAMADFHVTYAVSEHKLDLSGTGTMCMGDEMAAQFEGSGLTLLSQTCTEVVLADPDGKQLRFNASLANDRLSFKFSYKGGSCGFAYDVPMPGHPVDCAKQKASMDAYGNCVQGLAAAKVSAALLKVSAKLF